MERDILQFVPFREYRDDPVQLARQTLDEVPRQLLSFMESKSIRPKPSRRCENPYEISQEDLQKVQPRGIPQYFLNMKEDFINYFVKIGY